MLSKLKNIKWLQSLRSKLLLTFITSAFVPLIAVGSISGMQVFGVLKSETENKLIGIRDVKAHEIETFFSERMIDVQILSSNPTMVDSMRSFKTVVESDAKSHLTDTKGIMANFIEIYGARPNLSDANDNSSYTALHRRLHEQLQTLVNQYGYYDLFLIDADSGVILYSVAKAEDYGADLKEGKFATSNLGRAFRLASQATSPDETFLVDFELYGKNKLPAAFVAAPIFDNGVLIGVLAFQFPIDQVNGMMQSHAGMGKTGETYLLGHDKLMRSDSKPAGGKTLLSQNVDTESANAAINGETGVTVTNNYRDVKVISAYRPLNISGVDWVMLAEIDYTEAFAPINVLMRSVLIILAIVTVGILGLAYVVANQISRPILDIEMIARRLSMGDSQSNEIDNKKLNIIAKRRDEIGIVGRAFQKLMHYFTDMANTAQLIASGNLAIDVQPRSDNDIFGKAFAQMVKDLQNLVRQVTNMTEYVNQSAMQLTNVAVETGESAEDVIGIIGKIVDSSERQSQGMNLASETVRQVTRAIEGVAQGAQEQAAAAGNTVTLTEKMTTIIEMVSNNAQESARGSKRAAQAAKDGASIIEQSISGMASIKHKVGEAVEKVQEMGQRSAEIGAIVKTIDDIASQTNLLALNAAIEAARTGVQSKQMTEMLLNRQMLTQARLLAELLIILGDNKNSTDFWRQIARSTNIDNICITDDDGVISISDDTSLLGFRFPDDPKNQAYEFRQLLVRSDGEVTQPTQRRGVDNVLYKYVGVSRKDQKGIVQVGFNATSVAKFQVQVGGFAVVADEVRKLAEKSAGAAKEIALLIKDTQGSVVAAISAMDQGASEVENGVTLADEAGLALQDILQVVEKVKQEVEDIDSVTNDMTAAATDLTESVESVSAVIEENTAATEEMSAGAAEVMDEIESVASIIAENTNSVEMVNQAIEGMTSQIQETVSSAQALNNMADSLSELVSNFHLDRGSSFDEQIDTFREAHLAWVENVRAMFDGEITLMADDIYDHTNCKMGQWYYGIGQQKFSDWEEFQALEEPHKQLHHRVSQAVKDYNAGKVEDTETYLIDIERLSKQIIDTLNQLYQQIDKSENA